MNKCGMCRKKSDYDGFVWYTMGGSETYLCRSHYMKWCWEHKHYRDAHKLVKPATKAWEKMCEEEQELFDEWLMQQNKV